MAVVRAKLYVASLTREAYNPGGTKVILRAATQGEENKVWAAATPNAEFTLTIKNPLAADAFDQALGKSFWIDMTPVDED